MNTLLLGALLLGNLTVTSYRSISAHTDSTPFITASGERVNKHGVALSRNFIKRWKGLVNYQDIVYIENIGFKIVNDCMNSRHDNNIDIWVGSLKEEQEFWAKWKGKKVKVWLIKTKENLDNEKN